jgi:hypothetical protein
LPTAATAGIAATHTHAAAATTAANQQIFHLKAKPKAQPAGGRACDVEGLAT